MRDLIAEIRQTIRSNKLRTRLTGLSVAWGVFMLILLLGVARGVANNFVSQRSGSDEDIIEVYGGRTSMPYRGYSDGRFIQLRDGDGATIERENHQNVEGVYPSAYSDSAQIIGPRDVVTGMNGMYPQLINTGSMEILGGRTLNSRDIELCRRVIFISRQTADLLFGNGEIPVGRTVESMGLSWTIIGVYDHRWANNNYVPYTTLKAITGNDDDVYELNVRVRDISTEAEATEVETNVRGTLSRLHEFHPDDRNAVWVWNNASTYIAGNAAMGYFNIAMWVIGLLTLVTGIVGVSNIMFVSVRERTHEIGIRRAIGAKPRSILTQIMAESVCITAMYGYIGVFGGMVVLQVVDALFSGKNFLENPTVDISIAVQVTIALIVAGALAGLFPALKALKVKPVEALRDE